MRYRRILEGTLIFVFLSMFIRNVPAGPADTPVSLAGTARRASAAALTT